MTVQVVKKHLQNDIYHYTWTRDQGDGEYTGTKDQERIDKDEGYEVLYFIQTFINKHNLTIEDVHRIEDALHSPELISVVMRDELIEKIENKLKL